MKWNLAIKDYQSFLKIERGLSENTVENYTRDILKLIVFLEDQKITISPDNIDRDTIQRFVYETAKKVNARSQARIISGIRVFSIIWFLKTTEVQTPLI